MELVCLCIYPERPGEPFEIVPHVTAHLKGLFRFGVGYPAMEIGAMADFMDIYMLKKPRCKKCPLLVIVSRKIRIPCGTEHNKDKV